MNSSKDNLKASTKRKIIAIMAIITLAGTSAYAGIDNSVYFSKYHQAEGHTLELQGTGIKTMLLFDAFAAAFYQSGDFNGDNLGLFPKRIEVEYFITIPGERLKNYTVSKMKDNVTREEFKQISGKVELLEEYFVDLEPGDRFSLTYIPGLGTKFAHNGELTGIIDGSKFAHALFSVWVGKKPFDKKLKVKIMG